MTLLPHHRGAEVVHRLVIFLPTFERLYDNWSMNSTDTQLLERYRAAAAVLAELPTDAGVYSAASEAALLEANQLWASSQLSLAMAVP